MPTYRYTTNLILKTLGQEADDRNISFDQVAYWIQVVSNRLRYLRLNKKNLDTGVYLSIIGDIEVKNQGNKKYIELPSEIIDIDGDGGIDYIAYAPDNTEGCESNLIIQGDRIMPSEARTILNIPVSKPSPSQFFYYRTGKKIWILGLECVNIPFMEMCLHTAVNPELICDMDSEIPLDVSQEETLIARVLTLIRFGKLFSDDRDNEGSDTSSNQKNKTAISQTQLQDTQNQEQQ